MSIQLTKRQDYEDEYEDDTPTATATDDWSEETPTYQDDEGNTDITDAPTPTSDENDDDDVIDDDIPSSTTDQEPTTSTYYEEDEDESTTDEFTTTEEEPTESTTTLIEATTSDIYNPTATDIWTVTSPTITPTQPPPTLIPSTTSSPLPSESSQPEPTSNGNSGLSDRNKAIVGGVVGGIVGAALLGFIIFMLVSRWKRNRKENDMESYRPRSDYSHSVRSSMPVQQPMSQYEYDSYDNSSRSVEHMLPPQQQEPYNHPDTRY